MKINERLENEDRGYTTNDEGVQEQFVLERTVTRPAHPQHRKANEAESDTENYEYRKLNYIKNHNLNLKPGRLRDLRYSSIAMRKNQIT